MKIEDEGLEKTIMKKNKLEKTKEELESKFDKNELMVLNLNIFCF